MPKQREAFNFYRSYYDVYMELNDKDKVLFMDALLNKQFKGVEPTELKGMVNFAYLSQKHSIDRQVKGWEDKTKTSLFTEDSTPSQDPTEGGYVAPCQQEEEKGKEEEKVKEEKNIERAIALESEFETFWRTYDKVSDYHKCKKKFMALSNIKRHHVMNTVSFYVQRTPEKKYRKNPYTWLNGECWNDELSIMKEADLKEPKSFTKLTENLNSIPKDPYELFTT